MLSTLSRRWILLFLIAGWATLPAPCIASPLVQASAADQTFDGKVVVAVAGKLTIIDTEGDNTDFIVNAATKITLDGKPGRLEQLKAGDRVQIQAQIAGQKLTALSISAKSVE